QDGALDPHVAHAAAEIAVHVRNDFGLGGICVLREQRSRLHDLPGLAVTALRNLLGDPSALQWMLALGIKTFDGGDFFARGLRNRVLTGPTRLTVEVDRAGAAQASATSEFGTGHLQMFADDPQQGRVIRYVDRMVMPIDVQGDHTPSDGGSFKVADCRLSSATSPISAATRRVPPFAAASFGFIAVPVILVAVHNLSRRTARQAVMLTSCQFLARQIPNKPSRPYTFCSARQQGQTVPP